MRRIMLSVVLLAGSVAADAQIVVHDPAVTAKTTVTATITQLLANLQTEAEQLFHRMAQRLSAFTDLAKYVLPEPPRWRIHVFWDPALVLFAGPYNAALNYGDGGGTAYESLNVPVVDLQAEQARVAGLREFAARLATIDVADATIISGTNDAGHVRYDGRQEQDAIDQLESDVLDPSQDQGTTAVVQKLSGAALLADRQRQARAALLVGVVEQLLIDSKRERDTEASLINMQLTTWRTGRAANEAFVAGTGDALRTWRQP